MSINPTEPRTNQSAQPVAPSTVSRPPATPLPSSTPPSIASRIFAAPPDRTSPPVAQMVPAAQAPPLPASTTTATAASRAIGSPPQRQALPLASATSGHPNQLYMGHAAGAASSSSVRAAPPVAATPPGPIQTFPGLRNICGNDCWANSLLQMMATVPTLQAIAYELGSSIVNGGDRRGVYLFAELQHLMTDRALHEPISSANSNWFRLAIRDTLAGAGRISDRGTEDASEALGFILGNYDIKIRTQTPLHFDVTRTRSYNPRTDYEDKRTLTPEHIALHIPQLNAENAWLERTTDSMIQVPFGSLEEELRRQKEELRWQTPEAISERETRLFTELMWNYFDSPTPGQPLKSCINPQTGRLAVYQQARETIQFRTPPQEFILSLKRFVETSTKGISRKIDVKAPLLERFTLPAAYAGANATYEVDSFVCHSGGLGGGHYISYQKIDGNWYCFNDSHHHPADPREVKEALQNSYFQHYKKLAAVDPIAFLLPTREPAGAMAAALPPSAVAPVLSPQASASSALTSALPGRVSPLIAQDQAFEKMIQLIDQREILESMQKAIESGQGEDPLRAIFERLPQELRDALIEALALRHGKPLAVQNIQAQPEFKDEIIYGARIIQNNFSVLFGVLQKYTHGQISTFFGEIFSREESALLQPLIKAADSKNKETMLVKFNGMDLPLRKKICQLIYQADVIEKAEEHALRMLFSKDIALLGTGIIAEAIASLSTQIDSLSKEMR